MRRRRQAGNGAVTSFVYDCADRLNQLQNHRSDGTPVNIFTYTYDRVGNRTSALELSGDLTTWTYDPAYQLVHEGRSGTHEFDVTYSYDSAGNRTTQDDAGERTTYTYDAATTEEHGDRISQYDGADTLYHQYDGLGSTDALLVTWDAVAMRWMWNSAAASETSHRVRCPRHSGRSLSNATRSGCA